MNPCAFCLRPSACVVWGQFACYRCVKLWEKRAHAELPYNASADAHLEFTARLVEAAAKKRGAA